MPLTDMPLDQLQRYRPVLAEPPDLQERWDATLADARAHDLDLRLQPVDVGLRTVRVDDVRFAGFGGHEVAAWLLRPADAVVGPGGEPGVPDVPLPVVVEYAGYGGGRGLPHERLLWASAGYAHLVMDSRGQGSSWGGGGVTADRGDSGAPAHPGYMTRGVEDFDTFYYRRLLTDAVRAVDAARAVPGLDPHRVVVAGASQGGAMALAAAGLQTGLAAALVDVPFLCHVRRGVEIAPSDPFAEVARYLSVHRDRVDQVFRTLSYVDGVHLGARATAPAIFSAALMDPVCPPSTVFAAYHAYGGSAEMEVYPFNGHEGGQAPHQLRQLAWLHGVLQGTTTEGDLDAGTR